MNNPGSGGWSVSQRLGRVEVCLSSVAVIDEKSLEAEKKHV
jgi:hypothetical protein